MNIERYYYEDHWQILWEAYNNKAYVDFFRRTPIGLNKFQVCKELETITNSKIFIVYNQNFPIGIVNISGECLFTLSCSIGVLIFEKYQKQKINGIGLLIHIIYSISKYIFDGTNLNKIKVRVLKDNIRLNEIISKGGLVNEGNYSKEIFGKDECEYAIFRDLYESYKLKGSLWV